MHLLQFLGWGGVWWVGFFVWGPPPPRIALASYREGLIPTLFVQEMMSIQFVIGGQKCFQEQVKLVWLQRQTVNQP